MRDLKFKLRDSTLTSDVNQTLSNLLSQVNKTNNDVGNVSVRVTNNERQISSIINNPATTYSIPSGTPITSLGSDITGGVTGFDWGGTGPGLNATAGVRIPGWALANLVSSSQITIFLNNNGGTATKAEFANILLARTLANDTAVVDRTQITFAGSSGPTFTFGANTNIVETSDPINLQLDSKYDYWFLFMVPGFVSGNDFLFAQYPGRPSYVNGGRLSASDLSAASSMPTNGSLYGYNFILSWLAT